MLHKLIQFQAYCYNVAWFLGCIVIYAAICFDFYTRVWQLQLETGLAFSISNSFLQQLISGSYVMLDIFKNITYGINDILISLVGYTLYCASRDFELLTNENHVSSKLVRCSLNYYRSVLVYERYNLKIQIIS